MKRIIMFLYIGVFIAILFLSPIHATNTTINLENISFDNSILENGDSVNFNLKLSKKVDIDTIVTLSFLSSTAKPSIDFKVRYQKSYDNIPINQNNEALVTIPAGNLSAKITIHSIPDCLDEELEDIKIRIDKVTNNIILGNNISDSISIDNTRDRQIYYVSTDGVNDSNHISENTGSCHEPFSLNMGLYKLRDAKYTNPEKTILIIKDGIYRDINSSFVIRSGTRENPILIKAEHSGNVFFIGDRTPTQRQNPNNPYGLMIQDVSNIIIEGIHFKNYGSGVKIYNDGNTNSAPTNNILIENCTFTDNSDTGIEVVRADKVTIKDSLFKGSIPPKQSSDIDNSLYAIQDYGVAVYDSNNTTILKNLFIGRHHQSVSFKEGDINGSVERNIFVGALYTAIFLGQNYINNSPKSTNLIARYNIVMDAKGFPVKSPLRIDNVKNATVEYNYFKDFDYSNNLSAIYILSKAKGTININHNILAFGQDNEHSGGFAIEDNYDSYEERKDICPSIDINISNNILYKVHHILTKNNCSSHTILTNNHAYKLLKDYPSDNPNDPIEEEFSIDNYENLYQKLIQPILNFDNPPHK